MKNGSEKSGDTKIWPRKIGEIEKLSLEGESLRAQIYHTISNFLENQKGKKEEKSEKDSKFAVEEYLKRLPLPPEEHTYELKMEKRLKRMLEEQEKKKTKRRKQGSSIENSSV